MALIELGTIIGLDIAFISFNATLVWKGLQELEIARREINSHRFKFGKLIITWSLMNILGFVVPLFIELIILGYLTDVFPVILNNISLSIIGFFIFCSIILFIYFIFFKSNKI